MNRHFFEALFQEYCPDIYLFFPLFLVIYVHRVLCVLNFVSYKNNCYIFMDEAINP